MDPWLRFILAVLATWRVTHLLASEDGPADLIVRFRSRLGRGWVGGLMDCFYCLSLWISLPLAWVVGRTGVERVLLWLAFSGGAILLERSTGRAGAERPLTCQAKYEEDKEN